MRTSLPGNNQHPLNDPQRVLQQLVQQVYASPDITILLESQVISTKGFMGNFTSTIERPGGER